MLLCNTRENPDTEIRSVDLLLGIWWTACYQFSTPRRASLEADSQYGSKPFSSDRSLLLLTMTVHLSAEHLVSWGTESLVILRTGPVQAAWLREEGCRKFFMNGIDGPLVASGFPVSIEGGYSKMNWLFDVNLM